MSNNFDVVVIGAGPGGYVCAIRLAQLGKKVAIIEKEELGGTCLNWGCIPTKALLKSAEIYDYIKSANDFGIEVKDYNFNFENVISRSRKVAGQLSSGIKGLMTKNKITVITGNAQFLSNKELIINNDKNNTIKAQNFVIACGARSRQLTNMEASNIIWYAKQAMTPSFFPKKLLVIGAGAIGIEFASFYNSLGSDVSVCEMQEQILNQEDHEIASLAQKLFEKKGIKFYLNAKSGINIKNNKVQASITLKDNSIKNEEFDAAIIAIGVIGNTDNLGLEKTKVEVKNNQIIINEYLQTKEPNIYAIGDIVRAPWLAHKASHEGIIAAEHIAQLKVHPLKIDNIPACTYSNPQIASIGMSEKKAKELKLDIKVGRFFYKANGKAVASNKTDGMVKTIFDKKTGELLGAHAIGSDVTEFIQGFVIAKTLEATEQDLMHTIFPHPTLSEMMHESVLDAFDRVIHS